MNIFKIGDLKIDDTVWINGTESDNFNSGFYYIGPIKIKEINLLYGNIWATIPYMLKVWHYL